MYTAVRVECCKKDAKLLETGESQKRLFFLIKGVLRGFVVDENGRDITDCFTFRYGELIMGSHSIGGVSQVNIEALSDCMLLSLPADEVERLLRQHPSLLQVYSGYLQISLVRHWEIKRLLYQPAMQRYLWFLDSYPGLIDTVCNRHIASFLGITPVTLSRLRRQIREQMVGYMPPAAGSNGEQAGSRRRTLERRNAKISQKK